jgi:hypothetical protein
MLAAPHAAFPLAEGNRALREGHPAQAIGHYLRALGQLPGLASHMAANLVLARARYQATAAPRTLLYGRHASARLGLLAEWHAMRGETVRLDPQAGLSASIPPGAQGFQAADEAEFLERAWRLAAAQPCGLVHVAGTAPADLALGFLSKLIWGAQLVLDLDDAPLPAWLDGLIAECDGLTAATPEQAARHAGRFLDSGADLPGFIHSLGCRAPEALPGFQRLALSLGPCPALEALLGQHPPAAPASAPFPKVAVAAHLYHPELWPEIAARLRAVRAPYDLFVTTTPDRLAEAASLVYADFPRARLHVGPNLGMDIVPFLSLIPLLHNEGYVAVCKVHTKKGGLDFSAAWRALLLEALLGDSASFAEVAHAFAVDPQLDLVGPGYLCLSARALMYENRPGLERLARQLGQAGLPDWDWGFFAGTMFWARPAAFLGLARAVTYASPELGVDYQQDGKLEHAVERYFGLAPAFAERRVGLLLPCLPTGGHHALWTVPARRAAGPGSVKGVARQYATLAEDSALLRDSGLFDAAHYQAQCPELAGQAIDIAAHYLLRGQFMGYAPHPGFDPLAYRKALGAALTEGHDPFVHCLRAVAAHPADPPPPGCSPALHRAALGAALTDWRQVDRKPRLAGLVSIVVAATGQEPALPACLDALAAHTPADGYEVVVVAGSSGLDAPSSPAFVAGTGHPALDRNLGFAASRGGAVVFLEPAVRVGPGWLDPLLAALADTQVAAVQPQVFGPDGALHNAGVEFLLTAPLGRPARIAFPAQRRWQALSGLCLALRAADFAAARGYDAALAGTLADTDLCLRLNQEGGRYGLCAPESHVNWQGDAQVAGHDETAQQRFLARWARRLRLEDAVQPGDGFDAAGYWARNPDIPDTSLAGGESAWADYRTYGHDENRPARYFDTAWYQARHPDAPTGPGRAWRHYLEKGAAEGRPARFFDAQWFREHQPGLNQARRDPWADYQAQSLAAGALARFDYAHAPAALGEALAERAQDACRALLAEPDLPLPLQGPLSPGLKAFAARISPDLKPGLLVWWALYGRREHPDAAPLGPGPRAALFAPLAGFPQRGHFGLSPLLLGLLHQREDLRRAFDSTTEDGLLDVNGWFYAYGAREYGLADLVDGVTLAALDRAAPLQPGPEPAPSWLMWLVWRGRPDLRGAFDLGQPAAHAGFLAWFFVHGLAETGGWDWVAARWKDWLREEIPAADASWPPLIRAVTLLWSQREDLQAHFDPATSKGAQGLAAWGQAEAAAEPLLAWLGL